jgi:FAD:protein FMN transferase
MRKTLEVMGSVATIDIPDCDVASVFELCFELLKSIENAYSPYKKDNLLDRYNQYLDENNLPYSKLMNKLEYKQICKIIATCQKYKLRTKGQFDPFFDGKSFNPTGYVKGWAIDSVGKLLRKQNITTFYVSIGGDTLVESTTNKVWRIGITDPNNTSNIFKIIELKNGAIATSGSYERPRHLYDPASHKSLTSTASVTVIGKNIITADVFATALCIPNSITILPKSYKSYTY